MRSLSLPVAAISRALFRLMSFPSPRWHVFPGAQRTPMYLIYWGIGALLAALIGLWTLKNTTEVAQKEDCLEA